MQILKNPNFDFVRWRWHAIALSLAVMLAGAYAISTRGLPLGVEFAGGSIVIVKFEQMPEIDRIRQAVPNAIVQPYGPPENRELMLRVAQTGEERGGNLSQAADAVVAALTTANV